jgi:cytoskeleton protein RodZ
MSDDTNRTEAPGAPIEAPAEQPPTSFGARLRWERERAGLTVTDVAARLRLHPNQVRALEQETLTALPEAAYVRGFVRSYARIFNVEPGALLDDLASKIAPSGSSVVDGMTQQRDYSPVRAASREQTSRRLVVVGAVLLLILLGILGWYATRESAPISTTGTVVPAAPTVQAPPPAPPPVTEPATPAPGAVPVVAAAGAPEAAALLEPIPPPPLLKLRFTGASWAEVKDAEGKVLHSQHNTAGAEFVIEGTPPFYVVIGDTTKTSVEVRGEAYDLSPYSRQNVARFTIN